jgi:Uma2 family endonuclease
MTAEPLVLPAPPKGWTVDDLDRLPDDGQRYELIDGVVSVAPSPILLHQIVSRRLCSIIESVVPQDCEVGQAVGVVLAADWCPIPDVLVLRRPVDYLSNRFLPAQTVLAVEIVSPSTKATDRLRKPARYAASGIPYYWRIELEPLEVVAYRLDGRGSYSEYERAGEAASFRVTDPFSLEFDPADLLP